MKELHQAERYAPAYKDTKILFPVKTFAKKALDKENARRIMPSIPDTRYPIPDTRYPIPDTRYPIPA
ncbi:hypothetical protein V1L52_04745 [Treponema sp. HNW]|uniref:hypothetical protein n=1 Tax=Treponema sp. HNW TaxID=3116654 RepID=UPI003D0ECFDB